MIGGRTGYVDIMDPAPHTPDLHPQALDLITVRFELPAGVPAQRVAVVGDFNGWSGNATMMERQGDGMFAAEVELARGRAYRYKFLLDGQRWENDPKAHYYEVNDFGGDDSVVDAT